MFEDQLSRFDTIPDRSGQTDGRHISNSTANTALMHSMSQIPWCGLVICRVDVNVLTAMRTTHRLTAVSWSTHAHSTVVCVTLTHSVQSPVLGKSS